MNQLLPRKSRTSTDEAIIIIIIVTYFHFLFNQPIFSAIHSRSGQVPRMSSREPFEITGAMLFYRPDDLLLTVSKQ